MRCSFLGRELTPCVCFLLQLAVCCACASTLTPIHQYGTDEYEYIQDAHMHKSSCSCFFDNSRVIPSLIDSPTHPAPKTKSSP
jgi:hypothetical protein